MGASLSAHASYDKMTLVGRVIKENTGAFWKLVQDAILEPAFSEKELESLRTESLADIAHMKNSNGRLAGLALRRTLFAGTPLERPMDGTLSTITAIKRADILKNYRESFNRDSVVFAVASPLPETELRKNIEAIWKGLPEGTRRVHTSYPLKVPATPTLIVVEKPETSTGNMMFGQAGITAQDPDRYTLGVGNYSFGGEALVSRLFRVIRGELGWTYAIGSTYHASGPLTDQQGFYIISATPAVEFTAKTIFKTLAMWKEYVSSGLKSDELRLAEESLINSYPFEFESAEKRLGQKLHSYLYNVPLLTPEEYAKTIGAISNSDLKTALQHKQSEQGWLISLVADPVVIAKQLEEEQAEVPANKRLTISKKFTPNELVE
jgi:zinc protease